MLDAPFFKSTKSQILSAWHVVNPVCRSGWNGEDGKFINIGRNSARCHCRKENVRKRNDKSPLLGLSRKGFMEKAFEEVTVWGSVSYVILFTGFSRQEYWSGLPFPSPVGRILSALSTMTRPSWVASRAWLSFIELDKAVVLVWLDWLVFCDYGFGVSAL